MVSPGRQVSFPRSTLTGTPVLGALPGTIHAQFLPLRRVRAAPLLFHLAQGLPAVAAPTPLRRYQGCGVVVSQGRRPAVVHAALDGRRTDILSEAPPQPAQRRRGSVSNSFPRTVESGDFDQVVILLRRIKVFLYVPRPALAAH